MVLRAPGGPRSPVAPLLVWRSYKSPFARKNCVFLRFDVVVAEEVMVFRSGPWNFLFLRAPARSNVENTLHRRDALDAWRTFTWNWMTRLFPLAGPSGKASRARRSRHNGPVKGPRGSTRRTRAPRSSLVCSYAVSTNGPRRPRRVCRKSGLDSSPGT